MNPDKKKTNYRTNNSFKQVIYRDDHIEKNIVVYPEAIRDDVLWLFRYVREECNRDLSVLETRCKAIGVNKSNSVTYFTKVLNFTYFAEKNGKQLGTTAQDNFSQVVDALKKDQELATLSCRIPFIETGTYEAIRDYIDIRRAPDTICRFGLIVGATGTQKTACTKHYQSVNNHYKVVHLESPDSGSMSQLINDLAIRYGVSVSYSKSKKQQLICKSVNHKRTIIIENVQRLYKKDKGWEQPVFNFFQKLQDDTNCTVIMTCTVDFLRDFQQGAAKGYFEQFEGRCGGEDEFLILDEYPPRADIRIIAEAFGVVDISTALPALEQMVKARGRIRVLFNKLQKAAREANANNSPLTLELIQSV